MTNPGLFPKLETNSIYPTCLQGYCFPYYRLNQKSVFAYVSTGDYSRNIREFVQNFKTILSILLCHKPSSDVIPLQILARLSFYQKKYGMLCKISAAPVDLVVIKIRPSETCKISHLAHQITVTKKFNSQFPRVLSSMGIIVLF